MIIDENKIFFFANGDKYNLQDYELENLLKDDFSIYCRFKPNHEIVDKVVKEEGVFNGAIIAKNGKHFGLFFSAYPDENTNVIHKKIALTFWSHDVELGYDVEKRTELSFFTGEDDSEDRYFNVILSHNKRKKEFKLIEDISGDSTTINYDNLFDYEHSYTWIGAATLIAETHQSVFTGGDIEKIHIQKSTADLMYAKDFFSDYQSFLQNISDYGSVLKSVFSTDFSKQTYYKLMDMSGNGFHPVLFKKEWVGNDE